MTMMQILASNAPSREIPPPVNSVAPVITGNATVGSSLSVSDGTWTNNPESYSYQWYKTSVGLISGATSSSYTVQAADNGYTLYCIVTATNGGGSATATSNTTSTVTYQAPVNTVLPAITGSPIVETTLSVSNGSWNNGPTSYAYQWKRGGSPIGGATSSSYTITSSDNGYTLSCTVTATNNGGSTAATSSSTSTVYTNAPTNYSVPVVSGTAKVGETLSVSNGSWYYTPTSYSYQWYNSSGIISGATSSSYVIQSSDDTKQVYCIVTASNSGGSTGATSNYTSSITWPVPTLTASPPGINPNVSGSTYVGATLSCYVGTWNSFPTSYTVDWFRSDGTKIATTSGSSTTQTYTVQAADKASSIYCKVYAINDGGTGSYTTSSTASIKYAPSSISYFVVAGGGPGGSADLSTRTNGGGGGGAGGYLTSSASTDFTNPTSTVVVGAGGNGVLAAWSSQATGYDSQIYGGGFTVDALGGGCGTSCYYLAASSMDGYVGSGGGGGAGSSTYLAGGAGKSGQGFGGGNCAYLAAGGGGGGAGGAGGASTSSTLGGIGGTGSSVNWTGSTYYFGGGGGGGCYGGTGGSSPPTYLGGVGGGTGWAPASGTSNRGSGGGGWTGSRSTSPSGSGGSGFVMVRYSTTYDKFSSTSGTPTYTSSGGYHVYMWTGSGSFTL